MAALLGQQPARKRPRTADVLKLHLPQATPAGANGQPSSGAGGPAAAEARRAAAAAAVAAAGRAEDMKPETDSEAAEEEAAVAALLLDLRNPVTGPGRLGLLPGASCPCNMSLTLGLPPTFDPEQSVTGIGVPRLQTCCLGTQALSQACRGLMMAAGSTKCCSCKRPTCLGAKQVCLHGTVCFQGSPHAKQAPSAPTARQPACAVAELCWTEDSTL